MHELSLAMSLLDGVEEECATRGHPHVRAIHLRVGALAGVSIDALTFSYEMASQETSLAGTPLVIESTAGHELEVVGLEVDP